MEKDFLKQKKVNFKKLIKFGFIKNKNEYFYSTHIFDNQFLLNIIISNDEDLKTELIDLETNELYFLHLTDSTGEFVGKVREEYLQVLKNVSNYCFEKDVFKNKQTKRIIEYVDNTYNDNLEFLWEKFSENAIWRRKDNQKWYGVLLIISKRKLGFDSDEKVEIIDVRADPEKISEMVDDKTIFKGYHMNKKHWITIILDNEFNDEFIYELIDKSYELALK